MKNRIRLIAALAALGFAQWAVAYAGAGTSAGGTLLRPVGARAPGMAEAYTTSSDDAFGIFYNPAEPIYRYQVAAFYQNGLVDDSYTGLAIGVPLPVGRMGFAALRYSAGDITLRSTTGETRTVNAQRDTLYALSFALENNGLWAGGNAKVFNSKVVEEVSDSVILFDAGVRGAFFERLVLAAAVQNMGSNIKYSRTVEKLPRMARGGIAYTFLFRNETQSLKAALDLVKQLDGGVMTQHLGFEYSPLASYAIRAGYKFGYDYNDGTNGNVNFGLGWEGKKLSFDYAFTPFGELGSLHKLSMAWRFEGNLALDD